MVNIFYEDIEILDLDPEFFVSWFSKVCDLENGRLDEINLIFCSDEYLLKINIEYLNHNFYTDIITFDNSIDGAAGDLFISIDRVRDNASAHNVGFENETHRVALHGLLHILGYNDKSQIEKATMTTKENIYLDLIVPRET